MCAQHYYIQYIFCAYVISTSKLEYDNNNYVVKHKGGTLYTYILTTGGVSMQQYLNGTCITSIGSMCMVEEDEVKCCIVNKSLWITAESTNVQCT